MHSTPRTYALSPLDRLPTRFQASELIGSPVSRRRYFCPRSLFLTLLELVAGTNGQGYSHALMATFLEADGELPPTASALCQERRRVRFTFFQNQLDELLLSFEPRRWTWNGLRVYAIDGNELDIPRTDDILKAGYRGRALRGGVTETYYPRLYLVHAFDVLSGVTKALHYSAHRNELIGMQAMVPSFESNSLCLYDRLFMSHLLLELHKNAGSFFLARVKKNGFGEVRRFCKKGKKQETNIIDGVRVTLFKMKIPGRHEVSIFATNLPRRLRRRKNLYRLYVLRWQVENSFRDVGCSIKIEQWHSQAVNGILQELYCAYWLMNYARIHMALRTKKPKDVIALEYDKANFKLLLGWLVFRLLFPLKTDSWESQFRWLLTHNSQHRKRLSRHYPRAVHTSTRDYGRQNTAPRSIDA